MTDNPNFPAPTPSLIDFKIALDELESTIQLANSGLKEGIIQRYDKVEYLKILLRQLAAYVTLVANGDGVILSSSGFDLQRERQPLAEVSQPVSFRTFRHQHAGSVKLTWKAVKGARMYTIEMTKTNPEDNARWQFARITAQSSEIIEGLDRSVDSKPFGIYPDKYDAKSAF